MTARISSIACAALVAGLAFAEDSPPDAARRAEIGKSGRLAWVAPAKSLAFCDLDGSNAVESESRHPDWVRFLPDGKRVVACGQDRVFVVDSRTGAVTDLTADAKYGERFLATQPVLSPDGRRLLTWRTARRNSPQVPGIWSFASEIGGYALFDLDAGTRTEIGPAPPPADWQVSPPAAWSADGKFLYAVMGDVQTLTRFAPDGTHPVAVASVSPGRRITAVAVDGPQPLIAVQDGRQFEVRGADARALYVKPRPDPCLHPLTCLGLAWEPDGATALVDTVGDEDPWPAVRRRVGIGRAPEKLADVYLPRRADVAGATWFVEERRAADGGGALFRVATATNESVEIGRGCWPRAVGDVVVFWKPTKDLKNAWTWDFLRRPPGVCELWAYDPNAGRSIRLLDRGVEVQCWDVALTPPAAKDK